MATIIPFRGVQYNPAKAGSMDDLVCPPYDIISHEQQQALYRKNPYNVIRLEYGLESPGDTETDSRYTRAAGLLYEWFGSGILRQNEQPAFYIYEMEYPAGRKHRKLRGFVCLVQIEDYASGIVKPHETTLSGPKTDRLNLLRACKASFSQIYSLVSDPAGSIGTVLDNVKGRPQFEVKASDSVTHRIWTLTDQAAIKAIVREMADRPVFIADGHHRYETALAFRDEMRKKHGIREGAASEHVLMFLCNMDDEGIVILPTHRGIHSLPAFAEEEFAAKVRSVLPMESREGSPEDAIRALTDAGKKGKAIAWSAGGGRFHLVSFPDPARFGGERLAKFPPELRSLDVVLLHGFLLEQVLGITPEAVTSGGVVKYYKDPAKAVSDLTSGTIQAAFFVNPVTVGEFRNVSLSGHVLPQKSTFFYPKILTGLLIFSTRADERVPA